MCQQVTRAPSSNALEERAGSVGEHRGEASDPEGLEGGPPLPVVHESRLHAAHHEKATPVITALQVKASSTPPGIASS